MKNPRFWRERADETRTKAESFCLAESERKRLLRIAAEYDQLDDRAERWRTRWSGLWILRFRGGYRSPSHSLALCPSCNQWWSQVANVTRDHFPAGA